MKERKTCSLGDLTTNFETSAEGKIIFSPFFPEGLLLEAGILSRILKKIAIFSVQIGGLAFIRAWVFNRDVMVYVSPTIQKLIILQLILTVWVS